MFQTMSWRTRTVLLQELTNLLHGSSRGMRKYPFPVTFENVKFPPNGQLKLPKMPPEPEYDPDKGEKKYKTTKRMIEARGVEEVHTELIHEQYGLAAVSGGFISADDFKFIQERVNKNLRDKQFAIWRVDPPWLPRTKKAQGTRLGGGKGSIHHYVTPVKAKRIILEVGGHITEIEAQSFLLYLCERFLFPVEFVSEKILAERREAEKEIAEHNQNPFNWDRVIKLMAYGDDDILSLPFRLFVFIVAGLPLSALIICVLFSVLLHFEAATRTHCGVENWLPSISAAVSTYAPEMYIWRMFIAVHGGPRLFVAFAFRNFLLFSPLRPITGARVFRISCHVACVLNVMENMFLLGLTAISSVENHALHKFCFIGFAMSATFYMLLSTWLFHYSGRRRATNLGERSYEYKILACAGSIISMVLAMYLYWRHNTYCEPGVYTMFALAEYCVVLSNIAFHSTLYYDFHGKSVILSSTIGVGTGGYSLLPTVIEKDT
uniref:Ribosomal protein L10e L16 and Frag1 DRAM Sfk1 domain containing protein n=1 Tax=Haemonchus contortus TaxID=6289 RepID=W6NIB9_HAECO